MSDDLARRGRIKIAWLFLLTYLLVWAGGVQNPAVLWALVMDSHETCWTPSRDTIRLVFHHRGTSDEQNRAVSSREKHAHDLPSGMPVVSTAGPDRHPDHVIQFSDPGPFVVIVKKTAQAMKAFLPSVTLLASLVLVEPASAGPLLQRPQNVNPTLVCLRTVVLLT